MCVCVCFSLFSVGRLAVRQPINSILFDYGTGLFMALVEGERKREVAQETPRSQIRSERETASEVSWLAA